MLETSIRAGRQGEHLTSDDWVAVFKTAVEHMDEGFTIFDRDLRMLAWNDRFFSLLDLSRDLAYVGAPFEDFMRFNAERGEFGPGDPELMIQDRVERARKFLPHCMERVRPDGTVLEIRGNPIPGMGFVTVYKDITEQKRAEAALKESVDTLEARVRERTVELRDALETLRQSEQWIRLVADAVPALIGYVDAKHVYRFCNKHYQDWYGHAPETMIGRSVRDVFGGEAYEGQEADLGTALSGAAVSSEFSLRTHSGPKIECVVTYLPDTSDQGEVLGCFVLGQDITERKRAEAILRRVQKMDAVGQLTGGIAHDFNNLLTIIAGNLALVEEKENLDDGVRPMVSAALDSARRGAALVKRLLAYSRKTPLKSSLYDPKQVVSSMSELLRRTLGAAIEIEIRLGGETWPVRSDPSELESAILNMAVNSRDAMPDGGKLTVSVEGVRFDQGHAASRDSAPPGDFVVVSVTDEGCGMPPDIVERAFEPFFTSKRVGSGTGLGLSMVYGFARRSGGHATIDSTVGQSTTIRLYLPRCLDCSSASEPSAGKHGTVPTGSERILLVEDEDAVRDFVATVLRGLGYDVVEAENGRLALAVMRSRERFDLVLTDIEMPGGMSGLDLVEAIERTWPSQKTLLMSGYPDKAWNLSSRGSRETELILKPFEKEELARTVRGVLDRGAAPDPVHGDAETVSPRLSG